MSKPDQQQREVGDVVWRVLVALYIGALVSANAMAAKLINVFGIAAVTVGALAIPLVYSVLDLLNELYGKVRAREVVWMGFVANVVLVVYSVLCGLAPAAQFGAQQSAFEAMFGLTWRIVVASQVAYLVSSLVDVEVFSRVRRATGGRYLWLRQSAGTGAGQLVDSTLFTLIAFAFAVPWKAIVPMVLAEYLVKMAASPVRTLASYVLLSRLRTVR